MKFDRQVDRLIDSFTCIVIYFNNNINNSNSPRRAQVMLEAILDVVTLIITVITSKLLWLMLFLLHHADISLLWRHCKVVGHRIERRKK